MALGMSLHFACVSPTFLILVWVERLFSLQSPNDRGGLFIPPAFTERLLCTRAWPRLHVPPSLKKDDTRIDAGLRS